MTSDSSESLDDLPPEDGSSLARVSGAIRLGLRQILSAKGRVALAVLGVAIAVVLVSLMTGLGYGMTQAGTDALTYIDQDLWVTAGPLQLAPGSVGGVRNTLLDAHTVQRDIEARSDVASAEALAFQSVYVSADGNEFDTIVGVGTTGNGSGVGLSTTFERGDVHYADGSYDGPMTRAVIVSNGVATQLNVSTGDTIYMGGTLATASEQEFTVVGISRRFSVFLGAPTAVVHLAELQQVTGSTGSDRASMIGVQTEPGVDAMTTSREIEAAHPDLRVRTQQQQFRAVFENQGAILASAITLVALSLLVGAGLVGNTLGLVVYQQRRELAAIRAVGVRRTTLVLSIVVQGVAISVTGVLLGLAATPLLAGSINSVINDIVGFAELIKLPLWVIATGTSMGLCIGVLGAIVAAVRIAGVSPGTYLGR